MIERRLEDREKRHGAKLSRKQVHLVLDDHQVPQHVRLTFGVNYRELYDRTLAAYETAPAHIIGELLAKDAAALTLDVAYMGTPLEPMKTLPALQPLVALLASLNESRAIQTPYLPSRYILSYYTSHPEDTAVGDILAWLTNTTDECSAGLGIEDAVISNFTRDNAGLHLVDLDLFRHDIPFGFEVGFLMGDFHSRSSHGFFTGASELHAATIGLGVSSPDMRPLVDGYMSRIANNIITHERGLRSLRIDESRDALATFAAKN